MMAGSVNKVILIGTLGKDPEIKTFQNGGRIATFSIATNESWRDKNTADKRERTEWHNVTIQSDGLCKIAEQYLVKGSKIYIEGQLRTRKWRDKSGQDRYTTEVVLSGYGASLVLLGDKGGQGQNNAPQGRYDGQAAQPQAQASQQYLDDDIPF